MAYALSPIAIRVPLRDPRAAADHEPAGGLLGDLTANTAGQFEGAAACQRLVAENESNGIQSPQLAADLLCPGL
jgi:hypothetical protein